MKLRSSSSKVIVKAEASQIEQQETAESTELPLMASKQDEHTAVSNELALMNPFKMEDDQMPIATLDMQKQAGGKSAMSSVVDTAYDPLLVQINTARLTHANTVSLMINNSAQVYSQRVSDNFIA